MQLCQEQHSASGNLGIIFVCNDFGDVCHRDHHFHAEYEVIAAWAAGRPAIVHSHHTCSMLAPLLFYKHLALLCKKVQLLLDWQVTCNLQV